MSAKSNEFRGKTVEDALRHALQELSLERDQVDVQIVHEGARGIFGVGASEAVVRVTPHASVSPSPVTPAPLTPAAPPVMEPPTLPVPAANAPMEQSPAAPPAVEQKTPMPQAQANVSQKAQETLETLLRGMGLKAHVVVHPPEGPFSERSKGDKSEGPEFILDIVGNDLTVLIGRRGETLRDLEFMTRLMVSTQVGRQVRLSVDVEGYRMRRERLLRELARRMADRVKQNRQPITLEAMPPNERRIVHMTLRDSATVRTESIGEGDHRRVMILPK